MNKKLKCLLSAVLAVMLLVSAAIAMPATAAETADGAQTTVTSQPVIETDAAAQTASQPAGEEDADVFEDSKSDFDVIVTGTGDDGEGEIEPATEAPTEAVKDPDVNGKLNLARKGAYATRITLKWNKLRDVDGYRVYWYNMLKSSNKFKKLVSLTKTSVTISNLKKGAKYRFKVCAYYKKNGKIVEGKGEKLTAATKPAATKSLILRSAASKATVIQWKKVSRCDGYLLMRKANGVWKEYKKLNNKATKFRDNNVKPGDAYIYKLFAFRKDSQGYVKSASKTLAVVCGMCGPVDSGSTSRGNRIYLSWRDIPYATGYTVTYSTDKKNFKSLCTTTGTTASTKKFKEGTRVYFRIQPYRLVGSKKYKVLGTVSQFSVKVLANSFGADVGNTYVEIDISEQHLWFVKKGEVFVSTPVVTGNYNSMDTPKGIFSIRSKARNVSLVGAGYVSFVNYWMPFIGSSYGIHDASWRSSFGGEIYKGNGSHGCVNTPYSAVQKIYNNISVGTPVVIHK